MKNRCRANAESIFSLIFSSRNTTYRSLPFWRSIAAALYRKENITQCLCCFTNIKIRLFYQHQDCVVFEMYYDHDTFIWKMYYEHYITSRFFISFSFRNTYWIAESNWNCITNDKFILKMYYERPSVVLIHDRSQAGTASSFCATSVAPNSRAPSSDLLLNLSKSLPPR